LSEEGLFYMRSLDLIRWSGLAATIAGTLFIIINLTALLSSSFGQGSLGFLVRTVISPVGGALLILGLIGLYARQSEATDAIALVGFLCALFGTVLALAGNVWANLLAYFGWALFGVSSWQARVYPPKAAVLLTVGALIAAPFSTLVADASPVLMYMGVGASIVFNGAVAWLGLALFSGRSVAAEQTPKEE
jgi:hypothetical protein